jgi:phosphoglycerate dehydrogenase-like enzyme
LEKRLLEDPLKAKIYQDIINKYVEDGIAEEVPANEIKPVDNQLVFYLPHHAVIREDRQKTKTRVVFDAFAKDSEGTSLNSCIAAGPALQPDLCDILLRFRKKKIAVTSGIEKMFLQIS